MDTFVSLLKAARVALDLRAEDLADAAGVSTRSLSRLEAASGDSTLKTLRAVRTALENRGVVFLAEESNLGPGFRLPKNPVRIAAQQGNNPVLRAEKTDRESR